jgi:hypothetical protein
MEINIRMLEIEIGDKSPCEHCNTISNCRHCPFESQSPYLKKKKHKKVRKAFPDDPFKIRYLGD